MIGKGFGQQRDTLNLLIFLLSAALSISGLVSPAIALFIGIVCANLHANPLGSYHSFLTQRSLQLAVVLLGFTMNPAQIGRISGNGLAFICISVVLSLIAGLLLGRATKTDRITSILISAGTAICGGSAIAATATVLGAKEKQISVSLGCVFILNAAALLIFPSIGRMTNLDETQFGLWCAIAIHDTSSVLGAAANFGATSLLVATTVKVTRALFIIPLTLTVAKTENRQAKTKIPWFVLLFVAASISRFVFPPLQAFEGHLLEISRICFSFSLFLVGLALKKEQLKNVGPGPFVQAISLWVLVATLSLLLIKLRVI